MLEMFGKVFCQMFVAQLEASVVDVMVKRLDVAEEAAVRALAKDLGQGNSCKFLESEIDTERQCIRL